MLGPASVDERACFKLANSFLINLVLDSIVSDVADGRAAAKGG